ncbi:type VII secretion protein EccE [Actinoplanes sp. CA-030573]|uniref:type VII secretion protein EccE n=1 Tax=Actinoplanes sp. CA-030573 TaxID=3239898 RepID=UPI003D9392BA
MPPHEMTPMDRNSAVRSTPWRIGDQLPILPPVRTIVAIEVVGLACSAFAAAGSPSALVIALAIVGGVVGAVPIRRRSAWSWAVTWCSYRLRTSGTLTPPSPPSVTTFIDRSGADYGIVTTSGAVAMMLEVDARSGLPSLDLLTGAMEYHAVALDGIQLLDVITAAGHSRLLTVRLKPEKSRAAVAARGGGAAGAHRALGACTSALVRRLLESGRTARVLDTSEVTDLVASTAAAPMVESWTYCRSGRTRHVVFELTRLTADPATVTATLARLPTAELAMAYELTVGPSGQHVVRAVIRLSQSRSPDTTPKSLSGPGWRCRRLDGQHAPALRRTQPHASW